MSAAKTNRLPISEVERIQSETVLTFSWLYSGLTYWPFLARGRGFPPVNAFFEKTFITQGYLDLGKKAINKDVLGQTPIDLRSME